MRKVTEIVVHCDDSDNPQHDDIEVIRRWHTSPDPNDPTKPWVDVAYHLFIKTDGTAQLGRPIEMPGAHTRGYNTYSLGICLHGSKFINQKQKDSLVLWLKHYIKIFDLNPSDVYGHRELLVAGAPKKTCPNIDMDEIRSRLSR